MVDAVNRMIQRRFSSPEEVQQYRARAVSGLLAWEQTVVDRHLHAPARILDVGCGGGREAIALKRLGFSVTGVDISVEEVESARATAAEIGLDIDFDVCTGDSLSFPDASFAHAVIWAQALGNVATHASRARLLRECRRVVKPGGMLIFSVHNREACEPIIREKNMIQLAEGMELEEGDFILKGDSESQTPCYWHYFDSEEILRLCADAGWTVTACALAKDFGQADWETVWVCVARKEEFSNDS